MLTYSAGITKAWYRRRRSGFEVASTRHRRRCPGPIEPATIEHPTTVYRARLLNGLEYLALFPLEIQNILPIDEPNVHVRAMYNALLLSTCFTEAWGRVIASFRDPYQARVCLLLTTGEHPAGSSIGRHGASFLDTSAKFVWSITGSFTQMLPHTLRAAHKIRFSFDDQTECAFEAFTRKATSSSNYLGNTCPRFPMVFLDLPTVIPSTISFRLDSSFERSRASSQMCSPDSHFGLNYTRFVIYSMYLSSTYLIQFISRGITAI